MIKVLFVCHGNICRSPLAEFLFRDFVEKKGVGDQFEIASAATSSEEIGNRVHRGTRRILDGLGISCEGKRARRKSPVHPEFSWFPYVQENSGWTGDFLRGKASPEDDQKRLRRL